MFEKNDRVLLTARVIIIVMIAILAVASLALGITLAVVIGGVYFLVTFAGWFGCWILWVLMRLFLSYLCDIKLIRNKLYGESNKNLEVFFKAEAKEGYNPEMQKKKEETEAKLKQDRKKTEAEMKQEQSEKEAEMKRLYQLLSSGKITTEEYYNRVRELSKEK